MSLPIDTPTDFTVARVEVKKTLPAKDGQKPATILKVGLVSPDGEKGWAEMFVRDGTTPPGEGSKETLILTKPDNPQWALKAARPRAGGGGGPRRRDPAESKRIERMAAHKTAAAILGPIPADYHEHGEDKDLDNYLANFRLVTDWLVKDLP